MSKAYWLDENAFQPICNRVPNRSDTRIDAAGTPLLVLSFSNGIVHLACPPGFLSPRTVRSFVEQHELVEYCRQTEEAVTAFLQYRGSWSQTFEHTLNRLYPNHCIRKRNLVVVPLQEDQELLRSCKRDTRARLRTVFKMGIHHKTTLEHDFSVFYDQIAQRNRFSSVYRYSSTDFQSLCRAKSIHPISVFDQEGRYLGGSILGTVDEQRCDYILSAYNSDILNSGRAVLWESLIAARKMGFSAVNLGGGVQEGDSLERFKISFGGRKQPFYTFKIILDSAEYCRILQIKKSEIDLEGRFPPQ